MSRHAHKHLYSRHMQCSFHFMLLLNYCRSGPEDQGGLLNQIIIHLYSYSVSAELSTFSTLYITSAPFGVQNWVKAGTILPICTIFFISPLYHGKQFASPRSEPIGSSNKTPKVVRWHMVQISFLTQSQTLKANNSFYYHDNHFFLTSLTKEFLLDDMRNMGKGCQTCLKV